MDFFLRHILDIITVLIFILCVAYGSRRGIVRMMISVLGFVIAGAAAAFVSNSAYMYIYDSYVKEQVIEIIEQKADELAEEYRPEERMNELLMEDNYAGELFSLKNNGNIPAELLTDSRFRGTLNKVFSEYCYKLTDSLDGVLPDEIITSAEKYLAENDDAHEEKLLIFEESKASAAALIEEKIVRPVLLSTIKNALFAITFIAVSIVFTIISRMIGVLRHIPAIRSLDSLFGGILGVILGIFLVAVLVLLCSIFINITNNNNTIINTDIISDTYIFRLAYDGTFAVIAALLRAVSS